MYSFKNVFSENINLNSLLIMNGPTSHGKTWLLSRGLHDFSQSGARPQVAHMKINLGTNFEMVLYEFDHKCIDMICKLAPSYSDLLTRIEKVGDRFYDKILIEQQLYKILKDGIESQKDSLEDGHMLNLNISGTVDDISDLVGKYEGREYRETPLLDNIDQIVSLLKVNYENDDKQALMAIFYAVMLEKENDRKPREFYYSSYRDGKESLNFLFDLINDYAGYTELYYDEMTMTEEEWKEKVFPMRKQRDHPYLQDNYPHVVLAIEKTERLLEINDQRAEDWLHAIMLRLFNSSRFRRHFPVIFESGNSSYFGYEIYNKLNLWNLAFPTLYVGGYSYEALVPKLSKVYNQRQIKKLSEIFGKCIYHINLFTEVVVRSRQKFSDLVKVSYVDLPEFK